MIILGIDPGTSVIGYGVIEENKNRVKCLGYGVISIKEKEQVKRLLELEKSLNKLVKEVKPDLAVLEKLFFFKNQKTALGVSESRGVIMLTLGKNKVPFTELTPLQLKRYLSGYGRASKGGVQKMLKLVLNLKEEPRPDDAADALALALLGCGT